MRFLLTYGLDPVIGCADNKLSLNKRVKESVRTLLKEMVEIRIEGHDHEPPKGITRERTLSTQENDVHQEMSQIKVPMKQGDWICPKCNFLNFARNTRCLMCKERPPKRQLNPGEWECDSCNYINFRRNMVCLKCDHRRPIASNSANVASQPVNNNVKNHQTQPWFVQEKQSRHKRDDSLKFVESDSQDYTSSSSWNQEPGFMDFPVVGGNSDLSQNTQKQELWKMEMANKSNTTGHAREDAGRYNSSIFEGKSEFLTSGNDDDDDMAEWFGGRKKSL
ncbi:RNA-binding Ran Zn-finger protein [Handroanthus impetiginosus]|uniref:RNA-binding Ran Zn-finger protein n=1 Tax=Handroanthus impetiginosus TaxID=429701 RepID=A0A2G9H6A4_9LAMI|nr:RNA-binding Ran Zn-finger protein [Handroanthus impetiginosus]